MLQVSLKLLLHELVPVLLNNPIRFHGHRLRPIRHGHRQGIEAVVLGECAFVACDAGPSSSLRFHPFLKEVTQLERTRSSSSRTNSSIVVPSPLHNAGPSF
jgi:hypothetical protein